MLSKALNLKNKLAVNKEKLFNTFTFLIIVYIFIMAYVTGRIIHTYVIGIPVPFTNSGYELTLSVGIDSYIYLVMFLLILLKRQEIKKELYFKINKNLLTTFLLCFLLIIILIFLKSYLAKGILINFDAFKINFNNFGVFYIFFAITLGPIIEEIFFRGIILKFFIDKNSKILGDENLIILAIGVIISSLIFTIAHEDHSETFYNFIFHFIPALIFSYCYIKTKSLTPTIILHSLINLLAFLIIVVNK